MAKLFVILSPNVFYIFALSILFFLGNGNGCSEAKSHHINIMRGIRQAIGAFKIIFSFYKVELYFDFLKLNLSLSVIPENACRMF